MCQLVKLDEQTFHLVIAQCQLCVMSIGKRLFFLHLNLFHSSVDTQTEARKKNSEKNGSMTMTIIIITTQTQTHTLVAKLV